MDTKHKIYQAKSHIPSSPVSPFIPKNSANMPTTTYLQKVDATTSSADATRRQLVLETVWHHQQSTPAHDHDSPAAMLTVLDASTDVSFTGHVTYRSLADTAARLEIATDVFIADTRHMLTGEPAPTTTGITSPATAEFLYDFVTTDGDVADGSVKTFTWRKRKSAQLTISYGSAAMQRSKDNGDTSAAALLLRAIDCLAERNVAMRRMQIETDRLRRAHHLLRDDFDECVQRKLELEQDLLAKFMALLNTKKQHIQELELELSLQPQKRNANVDGAGDEKLKIVVADRNDDDDDDDVVVAGVRHGNSDALLNSQQSEDSLPLVLPRRTRVAAAEVIAAPRQMLATGSTAAGSSHTEVKPRPTDFEAVADQQAYERDTQQMIDDME